MQIDALSPQACAEQVRALMYADDKAAQHLGLVVASMGPGHARLRMLVQDFMTNGHHICHGGYIFLLADAAFAYSCNSYNQRTVAAGAMIDFIAAAQLGEELLAEAKEVSRGRRSGVYDVRVTGADNRLIAVFRGRSATIKGEFFSTVPGSAEDRTA
jgi:acyl-CoA thioesterase